MFDQALSSMKTVEVSAFRDFTIAQEKRKMEIRKSTMKDLPAIMKMYEEARQFMRENGNPDQWGHTNPKEEWIIMDIEDGDSYVCVEEEKIVGTFFYKMGEDSTYNRIYDGSWMEDSPYGVVHRITTDRRARGTASFCLKWAVEKSGGHLRIDTHEDNLPMKNLLEKLGFSRRGTVIVEDGTKRIAFEITYCLK